MDKNNNSINYLKKYMKYKKKYFAKNITGGSDPSRRPLRRAQSDSSIQSRSSTRPLRPPDYIYVPYKSEKHGFEFGIISSF